MDPSCVVLQYNSNHLPLSSMDVPIRQSLHELKHYEISEEGDRSWYLHITNVGQRLRFLRDTYKVIQAVKKKRSMGERIEFKNIDLNLSRSGTPQALDEDNRNRLDDDDDFVALPQETAPKRGRPRKRGGRRGRGTMRGRREIGNRTTRSTRRSQRTSSPISESEVLHLPPILPSQGTPALASLASDVGVATTRHIDENIEASDKKPESKDGHRQVEMANAEAAVVEMDERREYVELPRPEILAMPPPFLYGYCPVVPNSQAVGLLELTRTIIEGLKKRGFPGSQTLNQAYKTYSTVLPTFADELRRSSLHWPNQIPPGLLGQIQGPMSQMMVPMPGQAPLSALSPVNQHSQHNQLPQPQLGPMLQGKIVPGPIAIHQISRNMQPMGNQSVLSNIALPHMQTISGNLPQQGMSIQSGSQSSPLLSRGQLPTVHGQGHGEDGDDRFQSENGLSSFPSGAYYKSYERDERRAPPKLPPLGKREH